MSTQVEVLDLIMGSMKTQAMIHWMKNSAEKFLYVTPLLSEVEARLGEEDGLDISFPKICKVHTTKGKSLLELLKGGSNIATTHSMYHQLKDEHLALIKDQGYVLICDEQIETVSPIDKIDCLNLIDVGAITVDDETRQVSWTGTPLDLYKHFKAKCDRGLVYAAKSGSGQYVVTTHMPLKLITAAKRIVLCTYLFQGSILERFLTLKGITNIPFTEIDSSFFKHVDKADIRKLVNIIGSPAQLKKVRKHKLTTTWWRTADAEDVEDVNKLISAIGKKFSVPKEKLCWTVPKGNVVLVRPAKGQSYSILLKNKKYPSGADNEDFEWVDEEENMDSIEPKKTRRAYSEQELANARCYLPCNAIATNLYAGRNYMLHFQNRHPHITVKNFFKACDVELDSDHFALSEFLQWLWRSCIRNGEQVNVLFGSERMEVLFKTWLDD